jgi:hypothetical protein
MVEMNMGDEREIDLWEKRRINSSLHIPFDNQAQRVRKEWISDDDLVMNLDEDRCMSRPRDSEVHVRKNWGRDHVRRIGNRLADPAEGLQDNARDVRTTTTEGKQQRE